VEVLPNVILVWLFKWSVLSRRGAALLHRRSVGCMTVVYHSIKQFANVSSLPNEDAIYSQPPTSTDRLTRIILGFDLFETQPVAAIHLFFAAGYDRVWSQSTSRCERTIVGIATGLPSALE
jgi:hypothetical protein